MLVPTTWIRRRYAVQDFSSIRTQRKLLHPSRVVAKTGKSCRQCLFFDIVPLLAHSIVFVAVILQSPAHAICGIKRAIDLL